MSPLHDNLAAAYAALEPTIASRWTDTHPTLLQHQSLDALVETIGDVDQPKPGDEALRALIHLARGGDSDAFVVVLTALIPRIPDRCGPHPSDYFLTEVLSDLVFVILEAPDIDGLGDLTRRLTRRAYRRARRRYETDKRHDRRTWFLGLTVLDEEIEPWDHEQVIADRAQLNAVWEHMDTAIAQGRVDPGAWRLYRLGRLAPVVGCTKGTNATRSQLYRASMSIKREIQRATIIKRELSHI